MQTLGYFYSAFWGSSKLYETWDDGVSENKLHKFEDDTTILSVK